MGWRSGLGLGRSRQRLRRLRLEGLDVGLGSTLRLLASPILTSTNETWEIASQAINHSATSNPSLSPVFFPFHHFRSHNSKPSSSSDRRPVPLSKPYFHIRSLTFSLRSTI
ncbi:hypothetical protein L3X38_028772 [Prunus dulcis]|uniref:G-patch domain-containing protein n=1 Tax=Prunus dulcis TaxID=3755 RepID=A0AAD4VQE5_PRUDU|nr:hypothetical protein L3X38_028772 [Prunus dulcis]